MRKDKSSIPLAQGAGLEDQAAQMVGLFHDLVDLGLRVVEVRVGAQALRDYRQLVVEFGSFKFALEPPEVVLPFASHYHHLPLLAIERNSSID